MGYRHAKNKNKNLIRFLAGFAWKQVSLSKHILKTLKVATVNSSVILIKFKTYYMCIQKMERFAEIVTSTFFAKHSILDA